MKTNNLQKKSVVVKGIVPTKVKLKAIRLLHPTATKLEKEMISTFIDENFSKINCCVLGKPSKAFREFNRNSLHIDVGKKEVISDQWNQIAYTDNYSKFPELID